MVRLRMARPCKADSQHVIQSSSEVARSRSSNQTSSDKLNPDGVPTPGQASLAHPPLDQLPGQIETPTAGSSSLSIVSSGVFRSIGKGRKIVTMQGCRCDREGPPTRVSPGGRVAADPAAADVCRCVLTSCNARVVSRLGTKRDGKVLGSLCLWPRT